MGNKFDVRTIIAMVIGTVLVISLNCMSLAYPQFRGSWLIQACSVVVVVIAAVYGIEAGILIPLAACTIYGVTMRDTIITREIVFLIIGGAVTGHYRDKFMIYNGSFTLDKIMDFVVIETGVGALIWLCLYPLGSFYLKLTDLRITLKDGMVNLGICLLGKLLVCLPLLLLFNAVLKKKHMVEEARKEYLYDRK